MDLSILYLVSFVISLLVLLFMVSYGDGYSINQILLIAVIVFGNGGYYALAVSENLQQAILANKIIYIGGIFAPMLLFVNVAEVYRIHIPGWLSCIMYAVQFGLYFCVMTIGHTEIFYKTVELHHEGSLSFLTKEYGPMHAGYIISMYLYFALLIAVSAGLIRGKRRIGRHDIALIFFLNFSTMAFYIAERLTGLEVEIMPFVYDLGIILLLIPVSKLNTYTISGGNELIRNRLENDGYIFFDRHMRYMGCNAKADEIFPELSAWELEKRIPGSGGRFNTYLRQPLYRYIDSGDETFSVGEFTMKDKKLSYRIGTIRNRSHAHRGYIIEIDDRFNRRTGSDEK